MKFLYEQCNHYVLKNIAWADENLKLDAEDENCEKIKIIFVQDILSANTPAIYALTHGFSK